MCCQSLLSADRGNRNICSPVCALYYLCDSDYREVSSGTSWQEKQRGLRGCEKEKTGDGCNPGKAQERGKRAATENLAGIAGLAKALELATENLDENIEHAKKMRNRLIEGIRKNIPYCRLNGPEDEGRLCNNVNFSFQYVEGESILMMLDMKGVAASSGSACASGSLDPSHVLIAIGLPHEIAHGSLRLSVGDETTEEDVDYVVEVLPPIIQRLRDMSPLYEGVEKGDN